MGKCTSSLNPGRTAEKDSPVSSAVWPGIISSTSPPAEISGPAILRPFLWEMSARSPSRTCGKNSPLTLPTASTATTAGCSVQRSEKYTSVLRPAGRNQRLRLIRGRRVFPWKSPCFGFNFLLLSLVATFFSGGRCEKKRPIRKMGLFFYLTGDFYLFSASSSSSFCSASS